MTTQRIKLYALSTCSHCKAVKELLTHHKADQIKKTLQDD